MEKEIALGIINKFKKVKKPGSADLIEIPNNFNKLWKPLRNYFASISARDMQDVRQSIISENSYNQYSQHYLVVMGAIANVFGVYIYMTERLENDIIIPCNRLIIVGQKTEVSIVRYLGKYLLLNEYDLKTNLAPNRPKGVNPNHWNHTLRSKLYNPIFTNLNRYYGLKARIVHHKTLKLKDTYILEYMLKNLKFDFNDKNINPLYQEHDGSWVDKFKVYDGKWKNNNLLWARTINN